MNRVIKHYNKIQLIIIMENKQAVAVAVGVGAVGTALAYLGYSVYNNNDDISNLAEAQNNSWWANLLWSNSNTESPELYNDIGKEDGVQLKEVLKEEEGKNVKIETKANAWPTFWKNEYDADKKEKEEEEHQTTDVSDFN